MSEIAKFNESIAHIETKYFNKAGYFPILSTISGGGRITLGGLQSIFGTIGALFRGCTYFISRDPVQREYAAENYWQSIHGNMNIQRGLIESIPLLGNGLTFLYDKGIGLRVNYTHEKLPPNVDPIYSSH